MRSGYWSSYWPCRSTSLSYTKNMNETESNSRRQRLQASLEARDPRVVLQARLEAGQRVLESIQERLKEQPQDTHLLFIQAEHQQRRERLLHELRLLNLQGDSRYGSLAVWVESYLEQTQAEAEEPELSPEAQAEQQRLQEEQGVWTDMIAKVQDRLVKKPGDARLMRLLGEHQARLLKVQEALRLLNQGEPEPELVLEQVEREMSENAPEETPERLQLRREILVLQGMVEKTQERLFKKPELLHLKALIAQHEARIRELQAQLRKT